MPVGNRSHYGFTVTALLLVAPPASLAVMMTEVAFETLPDVAVNVAALDPAGTVTLAGTDRTELLLLVSVITVAAVALPVRVTVPVAFLPIVTLAGATERLFRIGCIVSGMETLPQRNGRNLHVRRRRDGGSGDREGGRRRARWYRNAGRHDGMR